MVFDDFYHALLHLFVFQHLLLESVGVEPLHFGCLCSLLSDVVVLKLVIHELFDKLIELFGRRRDLEYETLKLLEVKVVFLSDSELLAQTFKSFNFFFGFRVDDVKLWNLLWHSLRMEVAVGMVHVFAIVDIEHLVVVPQRCLKL
jgi:hypothetical protein